MGNTSPNGVPVHRVIEDGRELVPLPFFVAPESLPEALPSCDEIEAAAASSGKELLVNQTGQKVLRIGKFVVKYGYQVNLLDGQTLLFLQRKRRLLPSLSTPTIFMPCLRTKKKSIL